MKNLLLLSLLFLLGFILTSGPIAGQAGMANLNTILKPYQEKQTFSGHILLADQGKVIYQKTIGWSDRTKQAPLQINTKYRIASMTKSFTALLIMQLYEEGKLQLDQSVADLLPHLPLQKCRKVTVHHLLNHTSGLPNESDEFYRGKLSPQKIIFRLIGEKGPKQAAGKSFNYNNVDYLLLGLIIEEIRGEPWAEVLQKRILDPLSMKDTGLLEKDNLPKGLAKGYIFQNEVCQEEPAYYIENFYAAGAMYSTAADLLKWDQALYQEELISASSRALMYASSPKLGYVAYGSWTFKHPWVEGHPFTVERRGGILGFNSVIMRFPEVNKTLIILGNTDQFNPDSFGDAENLKEQLVAQLFSKG